MADSTPTPTFVAAQTLTDEKVSVAPAAQEAHDTDEDTASVRTTVAQRRKEWIQFLSLCLSLFIAGWNDGSIGPLIPRIQEYYHLGYTIVSLLFLLGCFGFMVGAFASLWLNDKLGFGKTLVLGASCQVITYAIFAPAPPFPVLVVFAFVNGFGMAVQDAQSNGYVAVMKHNADRKMGALHAVYGAGALLGPLVSTQFAQMPDHWSYHYIISCGIAVTTVIVLSVVFRFKRQEILLAEMGVVDPTVEDSSSIEKASKGENTVSGQDANEDKVSTEKAKDGSTYKEMFSQSILHYFATFILLYVGVELTIGGWLTTYIIRERGGGPSSGYIASGFYGGLMLGRVVLLPLNELLGEQSAILVYSFIAVALDVIVWRVRSLIGDAVAASFMGLVLGPLYPIVMNQATRVIPRHLLTGSIGWIAGFGQVGSAAFPFMTGALASRFDIGVMPPLVLAMVGVMIICWILALWTVRRHQSHKA
ncbi:MFS general substrate transporter [Auriculariales sp. MPI-PUGE-AT-0066]|nr:MFS general substrate transporter [Auriculariales sp. MPI-PUGE-AT-0066]